MADLRPALEICANCHSPNRGSGGDRVRVIREYAEDETNSETTSVFQMHLGGAGQPTPVGRAIHWHADPAINITYVSTDKDRQTIPYVKVTDQRGQVREYVTEGTTPDQIAQGESLTMDCVSCHNSIGHRIAPTAEGAVDAAIAAGTINRALPFVRRESVRLLKEEHPDQESGLRAIDQGLRTFYTSRGAVDAGQVDGAVAAVRTLSERNVFPDMKVTWGVYPDNIGHVSSQGASAATTAARPRMARASSMTTASTATSRSKCPLAPRNHQVGPVSTRRSPTPHGSRASFAWHPGRHSLRSRPRLMPA